MDTENNTTNPSETAKAESSVYTKILRHEIRGRIVYKSCAGAVIVSNSGQLLVMPIEQIDDWWKLPESTRNHLMNIATLMAEVITTTDRPARVGMQMYGFEVPHAHLKLAPMNANTDMDKANVKERSDEELDEIANKYRKTLLDLGWDEFVPLFNGQFGANVTPAVDSVKEKNEVDAIIDGLKQQRLEYDRQIGAELINHPGQQQACIDRLKEQEQMKGDVSEHCSVLQGMELTAYLLNQQESTD